MTHHSTPASLASAQSTPTLPRAAIIQMTSHFDPDVNFTVIEQALREAAEAGAAMAFLPEMSLMLDKDRKRSAQHIRPEADHKDLKSLCQFAKNYNIWLHTGSIAFAAEHGDKRVNRSHVIDDQGQIRAAYDKIHMFDVDLPTGEKWQESAAYQGGDRIVTVETPLGKMGLTICYDLRFPELFRALADQGVDIIALPAAFTVPTGEAHWHVLLRARAIETACFVVAAAQSGDHADGRSTYGHSLAIAPWGEVLGDAGASTAEEAYRILFAEIDPARIAKARKAVPLRTSRSIRAVSL